MLTKDGAGFLPGIEALCRGNSPPDLDGKAEVGTRLNHTGYRRPDPCLKALDTREPCSCDVSIIFGDATLSLLGLMGFTPDATLSLLGLMGITPDATLSLLGLMGITPGCSRHCLHSDE